VLTRATLVVLALVAIITFADWVSSPVQLCELSPQQHSENSKTYESAKEYCSAGKVVALWRAVGWLIDSWHDDLTAAATIVIAIFTTILGIFTVGLARSTRLAANAADLSARAAITIELPIIRAEPDGFSWGRRHAGGPTIDSFGIDRLVFSNLGRTKAIPLEVHFGFTVGDQLPETPIYTFSKAFSVDAILEADPLSKNLREFEFDVAPDLFDGLRTSSTRLWFYCNLVYLDFMQGRHEAGFCWERWQNPGSGGFRTDPTPAYSKKT
jgi:hypothetical protein